VLSPYVFLPLDCNCPRLSLFWLSPPFCPPSVLPSGWRYSILHLRFKASSSAVQIFLDTDPRSLPRWEGHYPFLLFYGVPFFSLSCWAFFFSRFRLLLPPRVEGLAFPLRHLPPPGFSHSNVRPMELSLWPPRTYLPRAPLSRPLLGQPPRAFLHPFYQEPSFWFPLSIFLFVFHNNLFPLNLTTGNQLFSLGGTFRSITSRSLPVCDPLPVFFLQRFIQ